MDDTGTNTKEQHRTIAEKLDAGAADVGAEDRVFSADKGEKSEDSCSEAFDVELGRWVAADSGALRDKSQEGDYVNERGDRMLWCRAHDASRWRKIDGIPVLTPISVAPYFRRFADIRKDMGTRKLSNVMRVPTFHHLPLHDDLALIWRRSMVRQGYVDSGRRQPRYSTYGDTERNWAADGMVHRDGGDVRHYVEVIVSHPLGVIKYRELRDECQASVWVFDAGPPTVLVKLLAYYDQWLMARWTYGDVVGAEEALMRFARGPCVTKLVWK